MSAVKVKFAGMTIQYQCSRPPQWLRDQQLYFAVIHTNGGERVVTCEKKRGLFRFGPSPAWDKAFLDCVGAESQS